MDKTQLKQAVLYADVSGSTRIFEQYGDELARSDIGSCLELLTEVAEGYDGRLVKTIGDELMLLFNNPLKAAMAATDMQETLQAAGEGDRFQTGALHIKIGWHYGAIEWRGRDPVGEAPVTAQQIIRMAKADEILTSTNSIKALPDEMKNNAHVIDRIKSEVTGEPVEVCIYQWEESDDVTQAAGFVDQKSDQALILESGTDKFRLDASHPECVIGRGGKCDLIVTGDFVSRLHASISMRHGSFHIKDNSSNGTVIVFNDGHMVRLHREEYMLVDSGRIGIGATPDDEPNAALKFYIK